MDDKKHALQSCLKACLAIIEKYKWLIDLYVLDFFVDNHWSILSQKWKDIIDDLRPEDLAFMIDLENDAETETVVLDKVWPLEILALKASIKAYSLKRTPWKRSQLAESLLLKDNNSTDEWPKDFNSLQNVFRRHIKPKKKHEIIRMADVASMLALKASPSKIVDIGAGLGHMSRLLSFGHGFEVTCMEAEGQFGKTAVTFDEDLVKAALKANPDFKGKVKGQKPEHVTLNVDPELKKEAFDEKFRNVEGQLGLIGLHTCGDLGPTIVRMYAESSKVTTLQSVGCCYMHIKKSFPLSQYLKHILNDDTIFNYTVLELGCHAIETYKD